MPSRPSFDRLLVAGPVEGSTLASLLWPIARLEKRKTTLVRLMEQCRSPSDSLHPCRLVSTVTTPAKQPMLVTQKEESVDLPQWPAVWI